MSLAKTVVKYSTGGTLGSLLVAYGLREFLRATGGGYYCCDPVVFRTYGVALVFAGWAVLVVTGVGFTRDRSG